MGDLGNTDKKIVFFFFFFINVTRVKRFVHEIQRKIQFFENLKSKIRKNYAHALIKKKLY